MMENNSLINTNEKDNYEERLYVTAQTCDAFGAKRTTKSTRTNNGSVKRNVTGLENSIQHCRRVFSQHVQ